LTIVVTGFGGIVPTGSVTVTQGDKTILEAAPLVDGHVTRAVVLDPSANVRVKYLGDAFYQPVAKIVPLIPARTRAAH
jgi:hypothetical protein